MAFIKKTWLARLGTGLNKFTVNGGNKVALDSAPDTITQEGTPLSAQNMNDLEDRIEAGFNEKQNILTFDNIPTENSNNPVTSGGLYNVIGNVETLLANI